MPQLEKTMCSSEDPAQPKVEEKSKKKKKKKFLEINEFENNIHVKTFPWSFPGGSLIKTLISQSRGPRFDPWSGD